MEVNQMGRGGGGGGRSGGGGGGRGDAAAVPSTNEGAVTLSARQSVALESTEARITRQEQTTAALRDQFRRNPNSETSAAIQASQRLTQRFRQRAELIRAGRLG